MFIPTILVYPVGKRHLGCYRSRDAARWSRTRSSMELWFAKIRDSSFVRMTPERNDFVINCPRRAELFQVCKGRAYAISPYENGVKFGLESYVHSHDLGQSEGWTSSRRLSSEVEMPLDDRRRASWFKKKRQLQPLFLYTIKSTNSWTGISLILS